MLCAHDEAHREQCTRHMYGICCFTVHFIYYIFIYIPIHMCMYLRTYRHRLHQTQYARHAVDCTILNTRNWAARWVETTETLTTTTTMTTATAYTDRRVFCAAALWLFRKLLLQLLASCFDRPADDRHKTERGGRLTQKHHAQLANLYTYFVVLGQMTVACRGGQ